MSAAGATGLAITNPLVKYRSLVQTRAIARDPSQHRLAIHLQKLYDRLKDYEPEQDYSKRLDQISRAVGERNDASGESRRNSWRALLAGKQERDSLALTRKLTSHESAMHIDSPKGLMLHGEVGTGKSMLVDLFADCLPNRKKRRWHFNTFMLETFAKLESLRRSQLRGQGDDDYSMLWLARDLIQRSPIIFLDEFQLPDRAASKIMTNLMTSFFHLGGVLIATSNRMPEELAKAAGIEFAPPPSRLESLGWQLGLRKKSGKGDRMFAGQTEFAGFLDVLKARCEVWEMEGAKDYRRLESGSVSKLKDDENLGDWQLDGHDDFQHGPGMAGWVEGEVADDGEDVAAETPMLTAPVNYIVNSEESKASLEGVLSSATGHTSLENVPWESAVLKVYGRLVPVPRASNGVTCWTFSELCKTHLGPADYITLASTYHTLILTEVPVLTWLMKNEARRFITLLDALYECRCKLIITAAAGPDDIFFPEKGSDEENDAVHSETFAEAYQDVTAPFRPNILSENPNYAEPDAEPDYTHARLAGLLNADAIEDDPPNKPHRNPFGRSFGRTDSEMERKPIDPDEPRYTKPNFAKTGSFTGEDERFAYKRAQSRLWEMCGAKWWARDEPDWHRPLPGEVRAWEKSNAERARSPAAQPLTSNDVTMGAAQDDNTRDERSFKHPSSPFRTSTEPPPKISWTHIWGAMKWGKKAGAWGQGPEGLKDRANEKR